MVAIITLLEHWRHFLLGTSEPFEIWTDHKNLEYFRKPQKVNRQQARWFGLLADYNFEIHHMPGTKNIKADKLSRNPEFEEDGTEDNKDITLLPEALFVKSVEEKD